MSKRLYAGWTMDEVKNKTVFRSEVGMALIAHIRELEETLEEIARRSGEAMIFRIAKKALQDSDE